MIFNILVNKKKLNFNYLCNIVVVNLIILSVGLFSLELIFGNWIYSNNINKLNIIRSRTIKYNIKGLYDYAFDTIAYSRDQYGLRGSFETPSDITLLTVGGSTTDQKYIADGETWQDTLQKQFQERGKVVIANAGIDGQSTFGHIKNFEWWFPYISGMKPKYILFLVGVNDFYKEQGYGHDALVFSDGKKLFQNFLREKSAIYNALRKLYGIYKANIQNNVGHDSVNFNKIEWIQTPLLISYDKLMDKRLKEYSERLEILITKTRDFGSIPIFVTQPTRHYRFNSGRLEGANLKMRYDGIIINSIDYYYMMRKLDKVTCSVSKKSDVICIDMAKERNWEDDDFYDFVHFTPKGTLKAGKYLYNKLKNEITVDEALIVK